MAGLCWRRSAFGAWVRMSCSVLGLAPIASDPRPPQAKHRRIATTSSENVGRAHLMLDRCGEAVDALQAAVKVNPDYAEAHLLLGIAYERRRENEKALDAFDDAIRCDRTGPIARAAREAIARVVNANADARVAQRRPAPAPVSQSQPSPIRAKPAPRRPARPGE